MKRILLFLCLSAWVPVACGNVKKSAATVLGADPADSCYSVVILGDTHYDTEPATVYHSDYNEPVEWLNRVQRAEFARNGEMWRERCPRLVKRAVALVDKDTKFVYQSGDLIQGDCGNPAVHQKMLADVIDYFKGEFGGLPFVTVEGSKYAAGTGNGVIGILGYLSTMVSGIWFGHIAGSELGWDRVYVLTIAFGIIGSLIIALLWKVPADGYEKVNKVIAENPEL